jgi:pectate lyase/subtilase family serine protease
LVLVLPAVILTCLSLLDPARAQTAGYQGFGAETPGGAGGDVVHVTNLEDAGPGSLREALSAGNRTVVFDVGGEIVLTSAIRVTGAFITIDGLTAPGGITLRGAGLSIQGTKGAHDIIVRGLRIRDATATESTDGITIAFGAYNIVVDHVSICCSADGNLDITYDSHDVTVSWSILAGTGKNMLIKYNASRVTLHHNIFVENLTRNPQVRIDDDGAVAADTTVDMRNNIVWNWGSGYGTLVWHGPQANIVNNYYSATSDALSVSSARAFVQGNWTATGVELVGLSTEAGPFPAPFVETQDAWTAANEVLANAGVRPLDAVDASFLAAIADVEPDLVVTALANPPASALVGASFAATDTVVNQGTAPVEASTVRYYLSNGAEAFPVGSRAVPELGPGATSTGSGTVAVPAALPLGAYYLLACADDTAALAESSETNNCLASTTAVQVSDPGTVDLAVTAVSAPPASAQVGLSFTVTDTVVNQGSAAAGASTIRYYFSLDPLRDAGDMLLLGTRSVPGLAAGATSTGSVTLTIPLTLPLGAYYLLACADDTAAVVESNEANNCLASTTLVQASAPPSTGADLVVTEMINPPATALPGSTFGARDWVLNQGTAPAGPSVTRYYVSLDTLRDSADILLAGSRALGTVSPGQTSKGSISVTLPSTVPAGLYYLLACADDTAAVAETNETNNCRASTIPVLIGP